MPMPVIPWLNRREAVKKAQRLLDECCALLGMPGRALGKSGREWIARRRWGDDPMEMRRVVYCAALNSRGASVEAAHFPPRGVKDHEAFAGRSFESLSLEEVVSHKVAHFFERLGGAGVSSLRRAVVDQVERPLIERCLSWAGGNQLKASRALGINRNTLRKRMRELGVKSR